MADKIDHIIGENLRQLRLEAGLSQAALGRCVGVTFQQVQKYETGANRLSAARLWKLCGLFSVPPDRFFVDAPSADTLSQPVEDLRQLVSACCYPHFDWRNIIMMLIQSPKGIFSGLPLGERGGARSKAR